MTRERRRRSGVGEGVGRYTRRSDVTSENVACRMSNYTAADPPSTLSPMTSTELQPPAYTEQTVERRQRRDRTDHSSVYAARDISSNSAIRSYLGEASFLPSLQRFPRLQSCTLTQASDNNPPVTVPHSTSCMISDTHTQDTQTPAPNQTVVSEADSSNIIYASRSSINLPEYTITELPHPSVDQPFYMMSTNNPQTNASSNSSADQVACSNTIDCLPSPFYMPTPPPVRRHHRRRRRHRRNRRRHHRRRHVDSSTQMLPPDDERIKPCCSSLGCKICLSLCLQFQKVLIFFATFGILCVLTGIILGVLRAPGNSFFTLSLMFVGLGLILLTMVLVGWKCTPADHEPCHMLFGLGVYSTIGRRDRRRRERLYWLGGALYPEFRHRRPPPSYAAAMHEYREGVRRSQNQFIPQSPPPSYKSHTTVERPGVHIIFPRNEEYPSSNPPTYRLSAQVQRPSIAILNDSILSADSLRNPARDSVSSTQQLVEAEYSEYPDQTPSGTVNQSYNNNAFTSRDSESSFTDCVVTFDRDSQSERRPIYQAESSAGDSSSVSITIDNVLNTESSSL